MAFLDGLGRAFKELDCAILGAGDYIFGSLNVLQGLDQSMTANVINGYRRLRGCNIAGDPQPAPPLITGGQCPGVLYDTTITYRLYAAGCVSQVIGPEVFANAVPGPLTVDFDNLSAGGNVTLLCPGVAFKTLTMTTGTNGKFSRGGIYGVELIELTAVRRDGQPDTCGNQPGPQPIVNLNIDVDVEYVDEGDNIVNVTVPVEFSPFTVNFNGDVTFPFDFSLGGIDFNGDVSFDPEFNFNVSGPKFNKGGGGEEFAPGEESEERPPAEPEANIVGAVVVATNIADKAATEIEFINGPDIYAPRLGSLKFAYSLGGATFWSEDIDVKGNRVFIPCPFSQGADAVAVSPIPGVSLVATPIRGFALATIGDIKVVLDTI